MSFSGTGGSKKFKSS
jgi:hypothetical protein